MTKGSIKARITCCVEIEVGVWSGGMTDVGSLADQVRKEGKNKLQKILQENGGCVVGSPRVLFMVMMEDE